MEQLSNKHKFTLIFGNAYTANESNDFVQSLILEGGKIIFIGKVEDSNIFLEQNNISRETMRLINLNKSQILLPGFIDSHVHPLLSGLAMSFIHLFGTQSVEEIQSRIRQYIVDNPNCKYIQGVGYKDDIFSAELPGHYKFLDQISSEIPIHLIKYNGHSCWCNSAVIKLAGICKDSVSPSGGVIEKDENGELTGFFHENAMNLLKKTLPKLAIETKVNFLIGSLNYMSAFGITSYMEAAANFSNSDVYKKLYQDEKVFPTLPRASVSIQPKNGFTDPEYQEDNSDETLEQTLQKTDEYFSLNRARGWDEGRNKLKINTVKLFIDGSFESSTAMWSPCKCHEELDIKPYLYSKEELQMIVDYLYKNDIQLHSHCIGDLATKMVIDAIHNAKDKFGELGNIERNYIAHLQLVKFEDIKRMKELNIYGNMSPFWFQKDKLADQIEILIGKDRLQDIYPARSLIDNGVTVGFGSDWCVSSLNPIDGIEVAITRRALGVSDESLSYVPEQKISLFEAVKAYTIRSAEILSMEKIVGTIEVGKLADFVILDKNIFEMDPWEIHTASVSMTMVDGIITYEKP